MTSLCEVYFDDDDLSICNSSKLSKLFVLT